MVKTQTPLNPTTNNIVPLRIVLPLTLTGAAVAAVALTAAFVVGYIALGFFVLGLAYVLGGVFAADADGRHQFATSFGTLAHRPLHFIQQHITMWAYALLAVTVCSAVMLLVQRARKPAFANRSAKAQAVASITATVFAVIIITGALQYMRVLANR